MIRKAFARVVAPSTASPEAPWLQDSRWQDLPPLVPLKSPDAIRELQVDALVQYLPAWLLAALEEWRPKSAVLVAVLDVLAPEEFEDEPLAREIWGERLSLLGRAQRDVVLTFLQAVRLDPELHARFGRISAVVRALPTIKLVRRPKWEPFCAVKRNDGTTIASGTGTDDLRDLLHDAIADGVDVSNAYLASLNLSGAPFDLAVLTGANFSDSNLRAAHLAGAELQRSNLRGADLRGAAMFGCDLSGADLSRADLRGADLRKCNATGATFVDANMSRADLSRSVLEGVCFVRAKLVRARLRAANLSNADLRDASLCGTDLRRASMIEIGIAGADARGILLDGADAMGRDPEDQAFLWPYRGRLRSDRDG